MFETHYPAHKNTVLHVIHSLEGGGTERTLMSLLRAFDPNNMRHVVLTLRDAGKTASTLPDHVACYPLRIHGRSRKAGFAIAKAVRYWRAQVIHARNLGTWNDAIVAKLFSPRTRLVLGFHGLESYGPFSMQQRRTARRGMWMGARFTSVSQSGCQQLMQEAGIPSGRIDLLANGVQLERYQRCDPHIRLWVRNALKYKETDFVIGIVGSLTRVKDHNTFIQAFAQCVTRFPSVRLLIVGDGPLRKSLARLVKELEIEKVVHFTGSREDIPDLLSGMDGYVCSSKSEGMNNALLEAMASGLPVIVTTVGDNAQIVRHQVDGMVIKPNSVESLADAIETLVDSETLCYEYGAAAYSRAQDFDFSETVAAYQAYYQSLMPASRSITKTKVLPETQPHFA